MDVGQSGEDWIFVLVVDVDSLAFSGDASASFGGLVPKDSDGTWTVLLL